MSTDPFGFSSRIQRANLDGTGVTTVLGDLGAFELALDLSTGEARSGGGAGGGSDITWNVTGVDSLKVICKNKTTEQKARIDVAVPTSGSCADLGLTWDPGDNVQIKAVGTVVSVADAGGAVTGITPTLLVCKNKSTEPAEKVRVENPDSPWNCTDEGLALAVGDRLQWKAKGPASDDGDSNSDADSVDSNMPWIGNWILINFLADDDGGVFDDDVLSGIGIEKVITASEWIETDDSGCAVTFSYSVEDNNRYSIQGVGKNSECPASLNLGLFVATGTLEFSINNSIMIQWFDPPGPGDDPDPDCCIVAFKWMRQ